MCRDATSACCDSFARGAADGCLADRLVLRVEPAGASSVGQPCGMLAEVQAMMLPFLQCRVAVLPSLSEACAFTRHRTSQA